MDVTLTIPVISRPDLFRRCVASIDIPCILDIYDNSIEGGFLQEANEVARAGVEVGDVQPSVNIGWTRVINDAIKAYAGAPFWLFANADVEFAPGDLQRLIDEPGDWVGINDWRAFKLTERAVELAGTFDENFFVYVSDADYERRCDLVGVDRHFIRGATSHVGSATIQEPSYAAQNRRAYPHEVAYYQRKWGTGVRMPGGYSTPFDQGGSPADWRLDLSVLRETTWRWGD